MRVAFRRLLPPAGGYGNYSTDCRSLGVGNFSERGHAASIRQEDAMSSLDFSPENG